MSSLGPITNTLEEELKERLRQRSLVIWLDKDGIYTPYVDELVERHAQGSFFAPVVPFRGSYLEMLMLLVLESYGDGLSPDVLLIHMPGHTEETIRKTPILELYRPGYRYRKALDTLICEAAAGQVSPDEIEGYLSNSVGDLAQAEEWLAKSLHQPKGDLNHLLESLNLETN